MPTTTIVTGVLLLALGLVGFVGTGSQHPTALIPAGFGIALAVCGFLAKAPERRKLYMHIAVTLGLLGFLGTVTGLIKVVRMAAGETIARPEAAESQAVMAFISAIFVAICVNSFIKARKARTQTT
jgi:multisubunit Na+/H+ antiporter MnhF subunit